MEELVDYLVAWTPTDPHWGDSAEGLARELQAAVRAATEKFSAAAPLLSPLDPTYVRAFFAGLEEAVREGADIGHWEEILTLGADVANRSDDGREVSGTLDRDAVWRFAQRAVASFLRHVLNPDPIPKSPPPISVDCY